MQTLWRKWDVCVLCKAESNVRGRLGCLRRLRSIPRFPFPIIRVFTTSLTRRPLTPECPTRHVHQVGGQTKEVRSNPRARQPKCLTICRILEQIAYSKILPTVDHLETRLMLWCGSLIIQRPFMRRTGIVSSYFGAELNNIEGFHKYRRNSQIQMRGRKSYRWRHESYRG